MRRFVFILMIVLLPLRGWMGEAMATDMAAINLIATQAANTPASAKLSDKNSMSDCDMHKSKTADKAAHKVNGSNSTEKSTCTYCQACHATGLLSTVQTTSFDGVQYEQPLSQPSQFASASIAHSQKPPIL